MAGLIYVCSIPPTALFLLFMKYQTPLFTLSCTDEHFNVGLLFVMERYRFHNLYLKSGSNQYPHLLHVLNIFNRVIFLSHRHIGIIIALSGLLLKLLLFVFIFIHSRYNQQINGTDNKVVLIICIKRSTLVFYYFNKSHMNVWYLYCKSNYLVKHQLRCSRIRVFFRNVFNRDFNSNHINIFTCW